MRTFTFSFLHTIFACVLLAAVASAQDSEKIPLLLSRSPSPANTVAYIHVPSLNKLIKDAGFTGALAPSLNEVWVVADLDLGALRPKWEAGYATVKQPMSPEDLAKRVGGYIDTVQNVKVVHSPQQTYFVPGTEHPERLGMLRPTDRSLLARWLTPSLNVQYSAFLNGQAKQPEQYLSFMMAVQLSNVISPAPLASRLTGMESLKGNPAESVADTLASIEGFSIIVGRESLQQCIVNFEFTRSPASLNLIAADLLAEILEKNGLAASEVKTWNAKVEGNVLALQGPITNSTLGGVLSVLSLQNEAEKAAGQAIQLENSKEQQAAYRSKAYFDQVNVIVKQVREHKAATTGAMASWNDKRARQIDELGTLNVDPEMVDYGAHIAQLLRDNALSVRQTTIQAGQTKAGQSLNNGYYGDGYGYYNSVNDYQRVTDSVASGNAYSDYRGTLSRIDELTTEIRRRMTDKYQIQF